MFTRVEESRSCLKSTVVLHPEEGAVLEMGLHRWPFSFEIPEDAWPSFSVEGLGKCRGGNGESSSGGAALVCVAGHGGVSARALV